MIIFQIIVFLEIKLSILGLFMILIYKLKMQKRMCFLQLIHTFYKLICCAPYSKNLLFSHLPFIFLTSLQFILHCGSVFSSVPLSFFQPILVNCPIFLVVNSK